MNIESLLVLVIISGVLLTMAILLCLRQINTQTSDQLPAVTAWLDQMHRLQWTLEELDNDQPIDYATGEVIARKRMEKLAATSKLVFACRVVVVFAVNGKQYKCSGIYGNDNYTPPKGEWFATIAKEALRRNGFEDAKIIAHIVMSPEA